MVGLTKNRKSETSVHIFQTVIEYEFLFYFLFFLRGTCFFQVILPHFHAYHLNVIGIGTIQRENTEH